MNLPMFHLGMALDPTVPPLPRKENGARRRYHHWSLNVGHLLDLQRTPRTQRSNGHTLFNGSHLGRSASVAVSAIILLQVVIRVPFDLYAFTNDAARRPMRPVNEPLRKANRLIATQQAMSKSFDFIRFPVRQVVYIWCY
jgi:hypothetical protein